MAAWHQGETIYPTHLTVIRRIDINRYQQSWIVTFELPLSVASCMRLSRIDVNSAMWHVLSVRLLRYLLTTHFFQHYSYAHP